MVGRQTEVQIQVLNWVNVSQGSLVSSVFTNKNRQNISYSMEILRHLNEIMGGEVVHTHNLSTCGMA